MLSRTKTHVRREKSSEKSINGQWCPLSAICRLKTHRFRHIFHCPQYSDLSDKKSLTCETVPLSVKPLVQAVAWYLRYPLSYRDLEEMFRERGFEVDHSTINRWVLAYAPVIEKRLRQFRRPHCGSVRIDETYVKIRGKWRYLYRAIDKHGNPVDFLLTAKRDLDAAKRFFRKMLKDEPLLSPNRIGTDGANTFPSTIKTSVDDGLLHPDPVHYVTKHLQQGIESDHFRVKKNMPKIGGFQSFNTARRTIAGFEAMLWLRKGFGFSGGWTVNDQNDLLARLFGLQKVNKA